MPQNPFNVEIRLADSEEIQTDFEVKQPDGSISHVHYDPYGLERQREARKQQKDATVNCHIKCDWAKRFRKPAYWYPLQVGYDRPVGEAVYAIDYFPDVTCFGESNGSAVLVTTRAFQAIP